MSPRHPPVTVIPPWLRTTVGALVAGLDGDGLDGALARTLADPLINAMSSVGTEVSQDARALVGEAIKHLGSTDEGGRIPLSTCASAIRALSQALEVIASPSVPTLPSGYPSIIQNGIPLEVLHHIFQTALASIDDYREHQQFMMSMALVSRSFHAAIAPTLRQTVHVVAVAQLSGLRRALVGDEGRVSQINTVYLDLDIKELEWREGKPWHGRHLGPVLDLLAPNVRTAFVRLWKSDIPSHEASDLGVDIETATAPRNGRVSHLANGHAFSNATELHLQRYQHWLDYNSPTSAHVHVPPPSVTRLYLDTDGTAYPDVIRSSSSDSIRGAGHHPWTVLAIPFHVFIPRDFPRLLPLGTSTLRHLEGTFLLPASANTAIADLTAIFLYLAPTLVHLTLRLDGRERDLDAPSVLTSLARILKPCEKLVSLEVGCRGLNVDGGTVASCLDGLPPRRITFLPFYTEEESGWCQLSLCQHLVERGVYPNLEHLTVVIEPEEDADAEVTDSIIINSLMDKCSAISVGLTIERRVESVAEYGHRDAEQ